MTNARSEDVQSDSPRGPGAATRFKRTPACMGATIPGCLTRAKQPAYLLDIFNAQK